MWTNSLVYNFWAISFVYFITSESNLLQILLDWIRIRIFQAAGSRSALRRTAVSGSEKNECGSTALVYRWKHHTKIVKILTLQCTSACFSACGMDCIHHRVPLSRSCSRLRCRFSVFCEATRRPGPHWSERSRDDSCPVPLGWRPDDSCPIPIGWCCR